MSELNGGWIEVLKRHDRDLYSPDRANPGLTIRMQQSEDRQTALEGDLRDIYMQRQKRSEHSWAVIIAIVTAAAASLGSFIVLCVKH